MEVKALARRVRLRQMFSVSKVTLDVREPEPNTQNCHVQNGKFLDAARIC